MTYTYSDLPDLNAGEVIPSTYWDTLKEDLQALNSSTSDPFASLTGVTMPSVVVRMAGSYSSVRLNAGELLVGATSAPVALAKPSVTSYLTHDGTNPSWNAGSYSTRKQAYAESQMSP